MSESASPAKPSPENPTWVDVHSIEELEAFFMSRLPAIRDAAKACGYAIGLHGSAKRDFDLIAVPWIEIYAAPNALAEAIQKATCDFHHAEYQWEQKPHGRIATSFPVCWTNFEERRLSDGHIDLSIVCIPRAEPVNARMREALIEAAEYLRWSHAWAITGSVEHILHNHITQALAATGEDHHDE